MDVSWELGKMNVGLFLGNYKVDMGGNFTFEDNILMAVHDVDINHHIYVFYYGKRKGPSTRPGIKYISLDGGKSIIRAVNRGLRLFTGTGALQRAADRFRIDIMWFITHRFEPVRIPYICTILDIEHRVNPVFPEVTFAGNTWDNREHFFSTVIPRAAYVVTGTEAGKQQIIDFYHPVKERVKVIPFPVSAFALNRKNTDSPVIDRRYGERPYLFYPAQFWPHKNHAVLLHTLKLLRERHQLDMDVVFCGADKGNLSHIKETSRNLGLDKFVRFPGFVSSEELCTLYENAFALVFPSFFGPDNLPPLEAFALGCPVIAANVAGAYEQMGDAALLIDPLSEEEIARAVIRLREDLELRSALIRNGRQRANRWTSYHYLREVKSLLDGFERYRRCWSKDKKYVHF